MMEVSTELNHDRRTGLNEEQEKQIAEYEDRAFGYLCLDEEFIRDWVANSENDDVLVEFMVILALLLGNSEPLVIEGYNNSHYLDGAPLRIVKDYANNWERMTDKLKAILAPYIQQKAYELWELNEGECTN